MEKNILPGKNGFSLVELIVVIVVIGILAAIAIPNYGKAKERALVKEAISNLKIVDAAEKIYYVEHAVYASCADTGTCNDMLHLQLDNTNWDYQILTNDSGYVAMADRTLETGAFKDCQYRMTTGVDEPYPFVPADCP